jgi:hemerythrin
MDAMHRDFERVAHQLATAPDDDVADALDAMTMHCEAHFEGESKLMRESAFPAMDCHEKEHAEVMESVYAVARHIEGGGNVEVGRRLACQLIDWFAQHLDYMDAAVAHWVCQRTHGGHPLVFRREIVKGSYVADGM